MSVPKLVKSTISSAVREIIDSDLSFQDALYRGYANISAMARIIKPRVEEVVGRRVNIESIITSLKRLKIEYKQITPSIRSVIANSTINVRTDVVKISIEKTKRTLEVVRRVLADYQEEFLQVSESISAITLIFDQRLLNEVKSLFKGENILEEASNLAAIIVRSPKEIIKTPGCAIAFYNQVSRRRINIEDTVSCYTDTIIVVKMDDVGKAFTALTELISTARRS
ncbi:MAG: hypothetical protein QXW83_02620 [Nitrososphaerales archaeon]